MAEPLWQREILQQVAGDTLRPGGVVLTERAADHIGLAPRQKVLDVGAGLGATVMALRRRYGVEAYGVDASRIQLSRGKCRYLLGAKAEQLPFGDDCFKALFAECLLSLLSNPLLALHEFCRVIEPQGYLILSDLYTMDYERTICGATSCGRGALTRQMVEEFVREAGFGIELFEDHSSYLRQLAAELLFASDASNICGGARGYYLLIARRRK